MTPFPPANILSHQRGAIVLAFFTISTFSTFASLLLAARKLAVDPGLFNKGEALVALAQDGGALIGLMRERGLTPLARRMARAAEEAEAMTHPGHAIDDAKAIFWQVAPEALSDPAIFARGDLDPQAITDAMVARIRASPHRRDFMERDLNEAYFRRVCHLTLSRMFADAAHIDSITPQLWRESLTRQGVQLEFLKAIKNDTEDLKEDTSEILTLVRELHAVKQTTVPEDTLIAMARKIHPRIANREDALRELDRAADLAAESLARGDQGSDVDAFVNGVLRRLAKMTRKGSLDEAAQDSDDAVDQAEAGLVQLLDASINQHILASDAEGAARQIERKLRIETEDPSKLFDALRGEFIAWYESGRDKGLRLDLEISIALAEKCRGIANGPDQKGNALNDFGIALQTLGERESGRARLEEAVTAFRAALEERTRERVPLDWANTTGNQGAAMRILAERTQDLAMANRAFSQLREAAQKLREGGHVPWSETFERQIPVAEALVGRLSGRSA